MVVDNESCMNIKCARNGEASAYLHWKNHLLDVLVGGPRRRLVGSGTALGKAALDNG